jgi:tetratricopeptide (TPR) repeat protein
MRRRPPSLAFAVALAAGALAAAAAPAPAAAEVHPFYDQRLAAGVLALSQGDAAGAERDLRIAAFGLLDEPVRLVVALAHLALAEQGTADAAGLDETLQRLLEVERSFGVWAAAEVPPATRAAIEAALVERVPESGLAAVPVFTALARRHAAARIAALPAAERRRELLAKSAAEPDAALWQLELGEIELAAGDAAKAVARAQRALASQPSAEEATAARCLRGAALARSGSCAAAVADLEACPASRRDPEPARALLECHARLGQWGRAKAAADSLPPTLRSRRDLARLLRQIDREAAAAAPAPAPARPAAAATPPAGAATTSSPAAGSEAAAGAAPPATPPTAAPAPAAPVPAALPPADRERLDRARVLMGQARRAAELDEPLALATAVADAHPGSVEAQHLAAEIAYRASRWPVAVTYFRRGGEPSSHPQLLFYLAVALWESGEADEARRVLDRALPRLPRSPFVDRYVERIRGGGP